MRLAVVDAIVPVLVPTASPTCAKVPVNWDQGNNRREVPPSPPTSYSPPSVPIRIWQRQQTIGMGSADYGAKGVLWYWNAVTSSVATASRNRTIFVGAEGNSVPYNTDAGPVRSAISSRKARRFIELTNGPSSPRLSFVVIRKPLYVACEPYCDRVTYAWALFISLLPSRPSSAVRMCAGPNFFFLSDSLVSFHSEIFSGHVPK